MSDDDEARVDAIAEKWITHEDPPMGGMIGRIYGAVREALRDGRVAENEACERLACDVEVHYGRQVLIEQQSGSYQGEVVAMAKRDVGQRIAAAIAKRRGKAG